MITKNEKLIKRIKKWVRNNGGNGYKDGKFIDEFHDLRKLLGMPTTEQGICNEWNRYHNEH